MSHPVLSRVFSIVLAVMCALMCFTGVTGLGKAESVRSESERKYNKMLQRIDVIEELQPVIDGPKSYEQSSEELESEQEQHDSDSAGHRMDIAENSATRGGLLKGADKLWEAKAKLAVASEQFNAGVKKIKDGIAQIAALEGAVSALNAVPQVGAPADDRASIAAAYAQASLNCDTAIGSAGALSAAAGSMGADASQLSAAVQGLQALKGLIASASAGVASDSAYATANSAADSALAEVGAKQAALEAAQTLLSTKQSNKEAADNAVTATEQSIAALDPSSPSYGDDRAILETQLSMDKAAQTAAGMELEMVREDAEDAQTELDTAMQAAAAAPKPVTAAGTIIGSVNSTVAALQAATPAMSTALTASKTQLQTTLDGLEAKRPELDKGAAGVQGGLELIWWQLGELDKDAEDYEAKRDELQAQAKELEELADEVEQLKQIENEYNTNRAVLMKNSDIKAAVDAGGELAESARTAAESVKGEYTRVYRLRLAACVLAIAGILGFAVIPAAYEKVSSRLLLILPAALTALCGAAAEAIYAYLGTGHQYAAMFTAIIAVVYLLIALPKNKTPAAG